MKKILSYLLLTNLVMFSISMLSANAMLNPNGNNNEFTQNGAEHNYAVDYDNLRKDPDLPKPTPNPTPNPPTPDPVIPVGPNGPNLNNDIAAEVDIGNINNDKWDAEYRRKLAEEDAARRAAEAAAAQRTQTIQNWFK